VQSFHSFRKNVAQALKDKRATPAEITELIGHEQGFTLSVYAPMQLPAKAPYGMIGGNRGNVGIIRSPVRASILPNL
jgi:hypothetical protein